MVIVGPQRKMRVKRTLIAVDVNAFDEGFETLRKGLDEHHDGGVLFLIRQGAEIRLDIASEADHPHHHDGGVRLAFAFAARRRPQGIDFAGDFRDRSR